MFYRIYFQGNYLPMKKACLGLTFYYGNFQTYIEIESYTEPPCIHHPTSTIVNALAALFHVLLPLGGVF